MKLFDLEDYQLVFSPQALALKPFKDLWDRDKTKDKSVAINELAYIYYMCDYKSDYAIIIDDEERSNEILSVLNLPKNWKVDNAIINAMQFYKDRSKGMIMHLYEASKILLDKIVTFAREVDIDERDDKGKPIYNVKQINDIIKQLGDTAKSVQDLEKMVKEELDNTKNKVGSKEKNLFEEGL